MVIQVYTENGHATYIPTRWVESMSVVMNNEWLPIVIVRTISGQVYEQTFKEPEKAMAFISRWLVEMGTSPEEVVDVTDTMFLEL